MKNFFKDGKLTNLTVLPLVVIAAAVTAFLLWQVVNQAFPNIFHNGMRRAHNILPNIQRHNLQPSQIRGWMTFAYLNSVFKLPPEVLQKKLNITNHRYPNLSVNAWGKDGHLQSAEAVVQVQSAINQLLLNP